MLLWASEASLFDGGLARKRAMASRSPADAWRRRVEEDDVSEASRESGTDPTPRLLEGSETILSIASIRPFSAVKIINDIH